MPVRVRYAPSPTGSPHIGNLRTAIYNWLLARKEGGQFLVRLEDTDRTPGRYVPEGTWDIEESLRYLGITPDEWWVTGGPSGPYVQSERLALYAEHAERLVESGAAYRCYCTRERLERLRHDQQQQGEPSGYDRHCRNAERREAMRRERAAIEGVEPSWVVRLAMPASGQTVVRDLVRGPIVYENCTQDDQILLKSDGFPTYFLACAVDDHLMDITHVIRGDDWLSSAAKFVAVIDAFGWTAPLFIHLPLVQGPDRKKLGKRHGSTQFVEFIEQGFLPEALFNYLVLLGWSSGAENEEILELPELLERFSIQDVSKHPAIFDYEKLKWMNGQYIRRSPVGRILGLCIPRLMRAGLISTPPTEEDLEYARRVIPLHMDRMRTLDEAPGLTSYFFEVLSYPAGYEPRAVDKWLRASFAPELLRQELADFDAMDAWTSECLERTTRNIAERMGISFGDAVHPTRVAVTGRTVGVGLFETLWALGRDRTLDRIGRVVAAIQ